MFDLNQSSLDSTDSRPYKIKHRDRAKSVIYEDHVTMPEPGSSLNLVKFSAHNPERTRQRLASVALVCPLYVFVDSFLKAARLFWSDRPRVPRVPRSSGAQNGHFVVDHHQLRSSFSLCLRQPTLDKTACSEYRSLDLCLDMPPKKQNIKTGELGSVI